MNKFVLPIALFFIAFSAGYYTAHTSDTVKYQQDIIAVQEAFEAQRKRAQELSQSLQEKTNEADKAQALAEHNIDTDYSQRLERLHNEPAAENSTDVPGTAGTACEVSASISEHNARVRRAFRELRAEVLTIARDRDITASHYNELISLYNSLIEQTNKGNSTNGE